MHTKALAAKRGFVLVIGGREAYAGWHSQVNLENSLTVRHFDVVSLSKPTFYYAILFSPEAMLLGPFYNADC